MGKSNRIRMNRANEKVKAPAAKQKKGMPSWVLTMITLVVAIAVLLSVVVGVMSANGTFMRMRTAAKTENYRVSGTVMPYFFWTTYENFQSENESLLELISLDTEKSLKEQNFGANGADGTTYMDKSLFGAFEGTWFDYFVKESKEAVEKVLVYCEEADKRNLTLSEEEKAEIDASISSIEMIASMYGYSANGYVQAMYGTGVKLSDVRKAMELTALANACMEVVTEEYLVGVSSDDINNRYNDNKLDYNLIDYSTYTFKVELKDAKTAVLGADFTDAELNEKKAEVLAKYKEMIEDAKAKAAALLENATGSDFKSRVVDILVDKYYTKVYEEAEIDEADLPEEAVRNEIKDKIIAQIKDAVINDKGETELEVVTEGEGDDKVTKVFGHTVSEKFATEMATVTTDVFDDVMADLLNFIREEIGYVESEEFSKWAFEDGRFAGETKTIMEGDGSKDELADSVELENLDGSFTVKPYILTKTQYKDTDLTKDIAYMLFSTEDAAKTVIEKLLATEGLTYESFEKIANENAAEYVTLIEDYAEGTIGSTVFDDWVFDSNRQVGGITASPLTLSEGTYAVLFFAAEGDEEWFVNIKNEIADERMESGYEALKTSVGVQFNDKAIYKLDA